MKDGIAASIAAAKALYEIYSYKNGLLWKKDHLSFDLYCQARFHYTKAHGCRLVETGGFIAEHEASSDGGHSKVEPRNEGHLEPVGRVLAERVHQGARYRGQPGKDKGRSHISFRREAGAGQSQAHRQGSLRVQATTQENGSEEEMRINCFSWGGPFLRISIARRYARTGLASAPLPLMPGIRATPGPFRVHGGDATFEMKQGAEHQTAEHDARI